MRVYTYKACSTCKKATKWLKEKGIEFEELPIRETPPSRDELCLMLGHYGGELRKLFNSAGGDYRDLEMKSKLPAMKEDDAIDLLAGRGNLIKRPFLLSKSVGLVGFKEAEWESKLG